MEQQLKMQDHFSRYQLEQYEQPNLSLTNGYHEEYEGGNDIFYWHLQFKIKILNTSVGAWQ